jgi:hypothetical protein
MIMKNVYETSLNNYASRHGQKDRGRGNGQSQPVCHLAGLFGRERGAGAAAQHGGVGYVCTLCKKLKTMEDISLMKFGSVWS